MKTNSKTAGPSFYVRVNGAYMYIWSTALYAQCTLYTFTCMHPYFLTV